MPKSKPLLYAELLSNIRQVSVLAALDGLANDGTKVDLTENGLQFMLHHHGDRTSLNLPGQVLTNLPLQKSELPSKELLWRLQLAHPLGRADANDAQSNDCPWPAKSLKEDVEFFCRSCEAVILNKGSIKIWKDLPSENWAEMMDFWHCHKPSHHEPNGANDHKGPSHVEESMASRGYGANTKFIAQPEVAFGDLTTFLLTESDCTGIELKAPSDKSSKYQKLICETCKNYLGHVDLQAEGYRLYKWRLKSRATGQASGALYYEPSTASIISSQLHSIMLAQCCSRLVVLPAGWEFPRDSLTSTTASQSSSEPPPLASLSISSSQASTSYPPDCFISMWFLSPAIRYSSTAQDTPQHTSSRPSRHTIGTLAMKVFWKTVSAAEAGKLMESKGVEDIVLPAEAIVEMEASLRHSASYLPPSIRKFKDWDVGLLERFEESDAYT